jgi:hypothetical protein
MVSSHFQVWFGRILYHSDDGWSFLPHDASTGVVIVMGFQTSFMPVPNKATHFTSATQLDNCINLCTVDGSHARPQNLGTATPCISCDPAVSRGNSVPEAKARSCIRASGQCQTNSGRAIGSSRVDFRHHTGSDGTRTIYVAAVENLEGNSTGIPDFFYQTSVFNLLRVSMRK